MVVLPTPLPGLRVIKPTVFEDERGWFYESYNREKFSGAGVDTVFVQDNHSRSAKNTLRGMHFQSSPGQIKLVRCTKGEIWDVAVDLRPESPTFGLHFGAYLNEETKHQIYLPLGFAHGFLVVSDWAEVQYKCSSVYNGATECGIAWDDPDLAIAWPLKGQTPLLSQRDRQNQSFSDYRSGLSSSNPS